MAFRYKSIIVLELNSHVKFLRSCIAPIDNLDKIDRSSAIFDNESAKESTL